jgi:flagellar biosynthesis protein FlhF
VTTGQRVPEDWEAADAGKLIQASLRNAASSPYDAKASDLGFIFSHSGETAHGKGMLDA